LAALALEKEEADDRDVVMWWDDYIAGRAV
jgi:hypothetical protein